MGSVADTNDTRRMIQQEIALALRNISRGADEEKIKRIVKQELRSQNNNKSNNGNFKEVDTKKPIDFMEFLDPPASGKYVFGSDGGEWKWYETEDC